MLGFALFFMRQTDGAPVGLRVYTIYSTVFSDILSSKNRCSLLFPGNMIYKHRMAIGW